jgi:ATP-dependent DNA helicase Q4
MVDLLDIKEEAILTLLCYLESANYIKIESNCYKYASIRSYKGMEYIQGLAKNSQFVSQILSLAKEQSSELMLDVMQLCEATKLEYKIVRQKLKSLEWQMNAKSGISIQLQNSSFYVRRVCIHSKDNSLDELNDFLWQRVSSQMNFSYSNFKSLYKILNEKAYDCIFQLTDCLENCDNIEESEAFTQLKKNSQILKENLNRYFNNTLNIEEFSLGYNFDLAQAKNQDHELKRLINDIRKFLSMYQGEFKVNGYVVARIFHGIGTPRFPAEIWGRNRMFWRSHLEFDFEALIKIATEQLLNF